MEGTPLVGRYADYAAIPLDVSHPTVDFPAFKRFVQRNCERCAFGDDNRIRWILFHARKPIQDGRFLLHAADPAFDDIGRYDGFSWDPVFAHSFPDLVDWFEALPFRRLFGVDLVTQTADIGAHLDLFEPDDATASYGRNRPLEPIYYRVVLSSHDDGVARKQSFFVTRDRDGPKHYVALPAETSTFALSSSVCYHGATHRPGHHKTTAVVYGQLNELKHLRLLERSLALFGHTAVRFPGAGPVSGRATQQHAENS